MSVLPLHACERKVHALSQREYPVQTSTLPKGSLRDTTMVCKSLLSLVKQLHVQHVPQQAAQVHWHLPICCKWVSTECTECVRGAVGRAHKGEGVNKENNKSLAVFWEGCVNISGKAGPSEACGRNFKCSQKPNPLHHCHRVTDTM